MSRSLSQPNADPSHILARIAELRQKLQSSPPRLLAERSGAPYTELEDETGYFQLTLWDEELRLSYPDFVIRQGKSNQEASPFIGALVLYYFATADGTPLTGRWISFSELSDGRFYNRAFQGYTGEELRRAFGGNFRLFEAAAQLSHGVRLAPDSPSPGEITFRFQALPRLPLLVAGWQGDEDFPPSFQILFDASANHYLPTDVCALVGSMLTRRLIKAKAALQQS